jgi:transposase-like protein
LNLNASIVLLEIKSRSISAAIENTKASAATRRREAKAKGANKTSVARIIGCSPDTLYIWMRANGLIRYIKTRTPEEVTKRRFVK